MTSLLYLLTICLPLATILIVFGVRYYALVQQAKARLANDDAYRQLAQSASGAQSQIATTLAALANPHRMRVVAALARGGRNYVSQLAREIGISRPLLHLHLQKLQEAGLVTSKLELSQDGKALNYFEVIDFALHLTPAAVVEAAKTLTAKPET